MPSFRFRRKRLWRKRGKDPEFIAIHRKIENKQITIVTYQQSGARISKNNHEMSK